MCICMLFSFMFFMKSNTTTSQKVKKLAKEKSKYLYQTRRTYKYLKQCVLFQTTSLAIVSLILVIYFIASYIKIKDNFETPPTNTLELPDYSKYLKIYYWTIGITTFSLFANCAGTLFHTITNTFHIYFLFFGACGIIYDDWMKLLFYLILTVSSSVIMLAFSIFFLTNRGKVVEDFDTVLMHYLTFYYGRSGFSTILDQFIDNAQQYGRCCGSWTGDLNQFNGVHLATLFWIESSQWGAAKVELSDNLPFNSTKLVEMVPKSCCRNMDISDCNIAPYKTRFDWSLLKSYLENVIFDTPCRYKLWQYFLFKQMHYLIALLIVFIVFSTVSFLVASIVYWNQVPNDEFDVKQAHELISVKRLETNLFPKSKKFIAEKSKKIRRKSRVHKIPELKSPSIKSQSEAKLPSRSKCKTFVSSTTQSTKLKTSSTLPSSG